VAGVTVFAVCVCACVRACACAHAHWSFGGTFTFLFMIEVLYVPSDCYYPPPRFHGVVTQKAMVCRIGFIKKKIELQVAKSFIF